MCADSFHIYSPLIPSWMPCCCCLLLNSFLEYRLTVFKETKWSNTKHVMERPPGEQWLIVCPNIPLPCWLKDASWSESWRMSCRVITSLMSLIKNPFVHSKVSAAALICFIMFQAAVDAGKVSKLIFFMKPLKRHLSKWITTYYITN